MSQDSGPRGDRTGVAEVIAKNKGFIFWAGLIWIFVGITLPSIAKADWILYRESLIQGGGLVHVATFDADERDDYNKHNCLYIAEIMNTHPNERVLWLCFKDDKPWWRQ